ncbi:MAG: 4Fe-4S binding protein [Bacteroidales bacterium]|nr:4Fe-4S binding protein [Bacteroidales bacterium]
MVHFIYGGCGACGECARACPRQ